MITLALALTGCAAWETVPDKVDQPVVIQQKLIPLTIPDELLEVPPYPEPVNPRTMTDKDLANWLIDNERRNQEIAKRLDAIKKYQERRLKDMRVYLQPAL